MANKVTVFKNIDNSTIINNEIQAADKIKATGSKIGTGIKDVFGKMKEGGKKVFKNIKEKTIISDSNGKKGTTIVEKEDTKPKSEKEDTKPKSEKEDTKPKSEKEDTKPKSEKDKKTEMKAKAKEKGLFGSFTDLGGEGLKYRAAAQLDDVGDRLIQRWNKPKKTDDKLKEEKSALEKEIAELEAKKETLKNSKIELPTSGGDEENLAMTVLKGPAYLGHIIGQGYKDAKGYLLGSKASELNDRVINKFKASYEKDWSAIKSKKGLAKAWGYVKGRGKTAIKGTLAGANMAWNQTGGRLGNAIAATTYQPIVNFGRYIGHTAGTFWGAIRGKKNQPVWSQGKFRANEFDAYSTIVPIDRNGIKGNFEKTKNVFAPQKGAKIVQVPITPKVENKPKDKQEGGEKGGKIVKLDQDKKKGEEGKKAA